MRLQLGYVWDLDAFWFLWEVFRVVDLQCKPQHASLDRALSWKRHDLYVSIFG